MICASAEEFAAALPSFGAICGLDLGTVTIGVAVSDSLRSVATPLETIKRKKFTLLSVSCLPINTVLLLPKKLVFFTAEAASLITLKRFLAKKM